MSMSMSMSVPLTTPELATAAHRQRLLEEAECERRNARARQPRPTLALPLDQIRLVQETFALIEPIGDAAAALFYGRLFELDPSLRSLFPHDLGAQGAKLLHVLRLAVRGLDRPDPLVPALEHLGRRHVAYGVRAAHYGTVAEALLWALGRGLGDRFTPAVCDAWAATYAVLTEVMQHAAAEDTRPPEPSCIAS
jgi:hemoglobin-like flavoprotein